MIGREIVPVLHLGQTAGVEAVVNGFPLDWLVVGLWCSRVEATRRLAGRLDDRSAERLSMWDLTAAEVRTADPHIFGLAINTEVIRAELAARLIDSCCRS
jgi:guanylate kinase